VGLVSKDLHLRFIFRTEDATVFELLKDRIIEKLHLIAGNVEQKDIASYINAVGDVFTFSWSEELNSFRELGEEVTLEPRLAFSTFGINAEIDDAVIGLSHKDFLEGLLPREGDGIEA